MKDTIVIALGGNAIIREGQRGTIEQQYENIEESCGYIADLVEEDYNIIITHGNGPQIGNLLLQNEAAKDIVPTAPLDVCVAETQGQLGFMIKKSLINTLRKRNIEKSVLCLLTQIVVDEKDPAFQNPTKPIGPFYTKEEAEELARTKGYEIVEDSGRGYRRVVASPMPTDIIEKATIKQLAEEGHVVIALGGGGISVTEESGILRGIEAVVDKDHASGLLANLIGAQHLVILTGVPNVAYNFGKPDQEFLATLTIEQAKKYAQEGQYPAGSMGPKIGAAIDYVENGGGKMIITSMDLLKDAMDGKAGTLITK
ncbi:MAG TPA: carbamate kinase [Epulopiscium sp.]|nr:carbamate kinase [Candidatus Epulonipiscium sp.]